MLIIVLAVLFVVSGLFAGLSLRQNNLRMLELRSEVFRVDEAGGDINTALSNLQQYVTTTMNTSLPKLGDQKAIQLKYTFERLQKAEEERVAAERQRINQEAVVACEAALPNVPLTSRVPCVQQYIADRPVVAKSIPKELYTFDFVSPRWSADAAGLALLVSMVSFVLLACSILYRILIYRSLKSKI